MVIMKVYNENEAKSHLCLKLGLKYLSDNITLVETGGPVHPAAVNTITYTLPASPPAQTLTHTYLAFHTWLTTKMGAQASLL